ncbi:unnamed protein product [Fusarium fujikuroi]|nr:uncharacterized protein FFFS_15851 [Fusarium fujikuroi]VTT61404.1 unnamed protein product [Fusarium fujikuroi]
MDSDIIFSPFDALGISLLTTSVVDERRIRSAYRAAVLLRHPDRCSLETRRRFPEVRHIADAKKYLEKCLAGGCLEAVIAEFYHWPQTFDSGKKENPFATANIDSKFVACKECSMVMKKGDIGLHLAEHGQMLCQHCRKPIALEARLHHLEAVHQRHTTLGGDVLSVPNVLKARTWRATGGFFDILKKRNNMNGCDACFAIPINFLVA